MTRNPQREVEELREHLQPDWNGSREARVWARLRDERLAAPARQRRRMGWALATAAAASILTLVSVVGLPSRDEASGPSASTHESSQAVAGPIHEEPANVERHRLADGSELRFHPESRYRLRPSEGRDIELELLAGELEFDVVHDPQRRFRVYAGEVRVEVVGTMFSVERHSEQVAVEVTRGQVRVEASGRAPVTLGAGERLELVRPTGEPSPAGAADAVPETIETEPPEPEPPAKPRAKPRDTTWLGLAKDGDHDEAWDALDGEGFVDSSDPEALMAAADVARLTKHPEAAVRWLDQIVREHSSSRLAPLAAFTRGRLLVERLGDPAEAARAFARARSLAPKGPLAEDALAREVEALAKAGETAQARERAARYIELYPAGQRLGSVRRWGGLD